MSRMSVATVSSPEFINITSMSPFASKCEIKVLYLGQNRNRTAIDKATATQMAQTLPGCPIVGYYSENVDDFRDHGDQVIIDGDGVKFRCQTKPYGFVAPDAKVWFKDFEDTDDFGNAVVRTYLMTEGYLWTEQYEEARMVINEGRPQSMELDNKTLKGHWSTDTNRGIDFFIINDAIFSKLCILGEDVEPCFEGSAVTAPDVSSTFSKDDNFAKTLYSMMKELKELTFSLKTEGGNSMELQELENQASEESVETSEQTPEVGAEPAEGTENFSAEEDKTDLGDSAENQNNTEEFVKKEDDSEKKDEEESNASDDETEEEDEEKKPKTKNSLVEQSSENEVSLEEKYALLETQFTELQEKYSALEQQNTELTQFKANVEDKEKDNLIATFYMLSDEDKKEVVENKSKYSLDEIEAKLSVICVRKKVNFNLNDNSAEASEDTVPVTFNLEGTESSDLPAWLKAVEMKRENM